MKRWFFLLLLMASSYAHRAGGEPTAGAAVAAASQPQLYAERIEAELRKDILPYWLEHARDRERGGFVGQLDEGSRVDKDALRGALLTSRILWTYSAAYRRFHDAGSRGRQKNHIRTGAEQRPATFIETGDELEHPGRPVVEERRVAGNADFIGNLHGTWEEEQRLFHWREMITERKDQTLANVLRL